MTLESGECEPIKPTPIKVPALPKQSGGGGHTIVTELPPKGDDGVEYFVFDDPSDCDTYEGSYAYNKEGDCWFATGGGGNADKYTFSKTSTGWVAKKNGTVIFTYVDMDTKYRWEKTDDGWKVYDQDNNLKFTYKDIDTDTTYRWEKTDDGWEVYDSEGNLKFTYVDCCGDDSDGTYRSQKLLTRAIGGVTPISLGQITGLVAADVVVGETLVYDQDGTLAVVTKDNGDGTYEVTTVTVSPTDRQGVRLGAVPHETDLPATCADAVALGWQTPLLGDFAYVREDTTHNDHLTEWVITAIDGSCNLTWDFSHIINNDDFQEQSTTDMSGKILTGGPIAGTFGTPIDPADFLKGVRKNGTLLPKAADGTVDVLIDDAHTIVTALPTTGQKEHMEYIVVDNTTDYNFVASYVWSGTKWIKTSGSDNQAHYKVTSLPTSGQEQWAEYVVMTDLNDPTTVTGTWVWDGTNWLPTSVSNDCAHQIVDTLPTGSNIDPCVEYLLMDDLTDPTSLKGTYVYDDTNSAWVLTSGTGSEGHLLVEALPTGSNIKEGVEYVLMDDINDENSVVGTYVWDATAGNWVETNSIIHLNGYMVNAGSLQDVPIGKMVHLTDCDQTPGDNYLLCDGSIYNIGDYPELETHFIKTYGAVNNFGGNGTTTWAVPDYAGSVPKVSWTGTTRTCSTWLSSYGNPANCWVDGVVNNWGSLVNTAVKWWQVKFPSAQKLDQYKLKIRSLDGNDLSTAPKAWELQGSHDGTNWVTIDTRSNITGWAKGETKTFDLVSSAKYEYYKFTNFVNNGYAGGNGEVQLDEIEFYVKGCADHAIKAKSTYHITEQRQDPMLVQVKMSPFNMSNSQWASNYIANVASITGNTNMTKSTNVSGTNVQSFVAPYDGYYRLTWDVNGRNSSASKSVFLVVQKNDIRTVVTSAPESFYTNAIFNETNMSSSSYGRLNGSGVAKLNKGDTLTVYTTCSAATGSSSVSTEALFTFELVEGAPSSPAEAMLKPNTWAVGVEQYFGDGVYGIRYAQTATANRNSDTTFPAITGVTDLKIVNNGGTYIRHTAGDMFDLPANGSLDAGQGMCPYYYKKTQRFGIRWRENYNNVNIDIWFLYTK